MAVALGHGAQACAQAPAPALRAESCVASGNVERGQRVYGEAAAPSQQNEVVGEVPLGPGHATLLVGTAAALEADDARDPSGLAVRLGGGYTWALAPLALELAYEAALQPQAGATAAHALSLDARLAEGATPWLALEADAGAGFSAFYAQLGVAHALELGRRATLELDAWLGFELQVGDGVRTADATCSTQVEIRLDRSLALTLGALVTVDARPVRADAGAGAQEAAAAQDTVRLADRLTVVASVGLRLGR